jgi:hypothetical protein
VLLGGGLTRQVEWASPSVQELVTYQVRIRIAGSTGAVGTWAYASVTAVGKFAPPGNVPLLSGFEAGGRVYLSWQPAVDIDIWRYEVRYGSTGGTWETAKMVDRVSTSEALGTRASAAHHIVAAGANPAWGTRNARLAAWTLDTITNGRMSEDTL